MLLLGLIIPVIAIFLECYPRVLNRKFGVDIWTHLLYLKEYHKQRGIPKEINNGFLIPGSYDYPPAFITILSKFPIKKIEKYEYIFSPFFDALHLIIFFGIIFMLTQNLYVALLTQLIYLLTPIIVLENSSATPRSLGYTLFTITFMFLFGYEVTNNYVYFFISIISGTLIFLSHRFTSQGFLFYAIAFTFIFNNPFFIFSFIFSFISAIGVSRGFYLKVLQGHIGNLKFWHTVINYRFFHQIKGNYSEHKSTDFVFSLYNQFLRFPPFILAITNPWVLPSLYFLFSPQSNNPFMQYAIFWVVISYILALVTIWVPSLRFLGEGQRYLELSAFPAAFISSTAFYSYLPRFQIWVSALYIVVGVLCLITIIVIQRKAIIKDKLRTITPELEDMFKYLKNLKTKPNLLCIPHQITTNTIYHTGCPVFVNADYTNISKIMDVYPFINLPIPEIMQKHKLDAILINEDYASISDLKLKKYKILKKFGNYNLVKVI